MRKAHLKIKILLKTNERFHSKQTSKNTKSSTVLKVEVILVSVYQGRQTDRQARRQTDRMAGRQAGRQLDTETRNN